MSHYLLVAILASLFCLSHSLVITGANLQSVFEQVQAVETTTAPPPNNVCGVKCETECIFESPQGRHIPELNDCYVIADTIRFFSENDAETNILGSATGTPPNNVTMVYSSCKSTFLNHGTLPLEYCRKDWASTIGYMVPFCHGWQHTKTSRCVAKDQSWSIEIQYS